ncbi:Hypothetical protein A7982_10969 [Minicystis rosea]|nr:Hypothetical protein A7982_10969 [Minicystis rosea]
MRNAGLLIAPLAFLVLAACDDKPAPAPAASATATAAVTATATPTVTATATAVRPPPPPMPPRPLPIGSSGPIQPNAAAEQQMMAISYTLAMLTPRGNDPLTVDKTYLEDILKKVETAIVGLDKGKTPPNPVRADKGNRKLVAEMGKGCNDRVPGLLLQRSNSTLKAANEAGVLVIACHDDKWECHQSTRDPADVLCHAAPRH